MPGLVNVAHHVLLPVVIAQNEAELVRILTQPQAGCGLPETRHESAAGTVVKVGGDWYYEEYARGEGISNLGGAGLEPVAVEPGRESAAPSEERNRILDLFKN